MSKDEGLINAVKVQGVKDLFAWWDSDGDVEFEDFVSAVRKVVFA